MRGLADGMVKASVAAALVFVGTVVVGHTLNRGTAEAEPGACGANWRAASAWLCGRRGREEGLSRA